MLEQIQQGLMQGLEPDQEASFAPVLFQMFKGMANSGEKSDDGFTADDRDESQTEVEPADKFSNILLEPSDTHQRFTEDYFIELEALIEKLLQIPATDFLPVDGSWKAEFYHDMQAHMKEDQPKKAFFLLANAALRWQYSGDSVRTREEFKTAVTYLRKHQFDVDYCGYIESWITLWQYKKFNEAEGEDKEQYKQDILAALDDPLVYSNHDLFSLKALLFFGALPGLEQYADFDRGVEILLPEEGFNTMAIPVSFTEFDQLRFKVFNEQVFSKIFSGSARKSRLDKYFLQLASRMMVLQSADAHAEFATYCQKYLFLSSREYQDVDFCNWYFSREFRHVFLGAKTTLSQKKEGASHHGSQHFFGRSEIFQVLTDLMEANRLSRLPPDETDAREAALHYNRLAEHYPGHFAAAYHWYKEASLFGAAGNAAEKLSTFWKSQDALTAAFWDEKSKEMYNKAELKRKPASKSEPKETFDLDKALAYIGEKEPPAPEPAAKNSGDKSRQTEQPQRQSSEAGSEPVVSDEDEISEPSTTSTVSQAVICVYPKAPNRVDQTLASDSQWLVKGHSANLKPYQRLLSENWNPKIKLALKLINQFREEGNIEREQEVYRALLDDENKRTLIGIERIWEEYAWTILHEYDDFLGRGVIPSQRREDFKKQIEMARDKYLLPALALKLGMEQMNADIKPGAIWDWTEQVLDKPEFKQNPDENAQFRRRMRYLFSSMGHVNSLLAMTTPGKNDNLRDAARTWYGYKKIDTSYFRQTPGAGEQ